MPERDDAHLIESSSEVSRISGQLIGAMFAFASAIQSHNDTHWRYDLLRSRRWHAACVAMRMAVHPQIVYQFLSKREWKSNWRMSCANGGSFIFVTNLGSSNVSARWAKTLCECAHHNVHVFWIAAKEIDDATAIWPHCANTVRLVQIHVRLVLLFQRKHFGQFNDRSLHTEHTLDHNQYLTPGFAGLGLALDDCIFQNAFQIGHIVVMEYFRCGARQTQPQNDRCMVLLVAHHQTAARYQRRQIQWIRSKTHSKYKRIFGPQKSSGQRFKFIVQWHCTQFGSWTACGQTIIVYRLNGIISAWTGICGESQIIIRSQIQAFRFCAGESVCRLQKWNLIKNVVSVLSHAKLQLTRMSNTDLWWYDLSVWFPHQAHW